MGGGGRAGMQSLWITFRPPPLPPPSFLPPLFLSVIQRVHGEEGGSEGGGCCGWDEEREGERGGGVVGLRVKMFTGVQKSSHRSVFLRFQLRNRLRFASRSKSDFIISLC